MTARDFARVVTRNLTGHNRHKCLLFFPKNNINKDNRFDEMPFFSVCSKYYNTTCNCPVTESKTFMF